MLFIKNLNFFVYIILTITKQICYNNLVMEFNLIGENNMATGDRIKRVRIFRGLTQKEFGKLIGFDEKTADVRVAQYESNTRTPKEDLLKKMADVLDVNYHSLYEPSLYAAEDVMYTLFELDEHYGITVHEVADEEYPEKKHYAFQIKSNLLDDFMMEWQQRKKDLADGIISKAEYTEWKLNWPQTADDCGKFKPSKEWRDHHTTTEDIE